MTGPVACSDCRDGLHDACSGFGCECGCPEATRMRLAAAWSERGDAGCCRLLFAVGVLAVLAFAAWRWYVATHPESGG